jgi:hypothetical protein
LTESRIRVLIEGMPAFYEKVRKLGRTKRGRTPMPLPNAEDYPPVGSLADVVATTFSDDPAEVAFYQDMMRLDELWALRRRRGGARAAIQAAIATLQQRTVVVEGGTLDRGMSELFDVMFSARIAQFESITDEELAAIERCAPEIEQAFNRRMQWLHPRRSR